jgi:type IX secretion system PorP/SprF family membrane protein
MMIRRTLFIGQILLFFSLAVQAQDGTFSQFYVDRMNLNPALTALDEGLSGTAHYRNQWFLADRGFQTYSVCAECRDEVIRSGYGFYAMHNREGAGRLAMSTLGGAYSFWVPMGSNQGFYIGANAAFVQRSLDFNRLIFSDQIAPYDGILNGATGAPVPLESRAFADGGLGLAYRGGISGNRQVNGRSVRREVAFLSGGFSYQHGNKPVESLRGLDFSLPARWTYHAGLSMPFLADWSSSTRYYCTVSLLARIQTQANLRSSMFGIAWLYRGLEPGVYIHHRALPFQGKHSDNMIVSLAWETKKAGKFYRIQGSYDIGVGGIKTAAGGAFELSLRARTADLCKFKHKRISRKPGNSRPISTYKCPTFDKWSLSRQH